MGIDPTKNAPKSLDPVWARINQLRPNLTALGNGQDVTTALTNGNATIAVTCTCNAVSAIASGTKLELVVPRTACYMVGDAYYIHKNIPAGQLLLRRALRELPVRATRRRATWRRTRRSFRPSRAAAIPAYMKAQPRAFPLTAAQIEGGEQASSRRFR